jgi:hypothetical protein
MPENWRPVKGYEDDYLISDHGRLKNLRTDKISNNDPSKLYGYVQYVLCKNGVTFAIKAHRLVAEAFLGNMYNHKEVHHLNGIKHDNRVENLMWVSPQLHALYSKELYNLQNQEREERWQKKLRAILNLLQNIPGKCDHA